MADFSEGYKQLRRTRGLAGGTRFALRQLADLLRNVGSEWQSPSGPRVPMARQGLRAWPRALGQDLLFGVRSLRRDPVFVATVVVVIGLGIAAVVTVYGMVDAILLEPMPYPESDRIVSISETHRVIQRKSVAYPNYVDWLTRNSTLEDIAARTWWTVNLTDESSARAVSGMGATPNLMALLGVEPIRGRMFTQTEADERGQVTVVSEGFWRQSLAADPAAVGRELRLDGDAYTIVGVVPEQHEFPLAGAVLWVPLQTAIGENSVNDRTNHPGIEAFARLRAGVSLELAQADLDRIATQLADEYARSNAEAGVTMLPLHARVTRGSSATLWILFGAVVAVLLGVCANVASLMLARATRRHGEIAVRAALGASRARLARQLLSEGAVLSLTAGVLGIACAAVAMGLIRRAEGLGLPRLATLDVDLSVAAFTLALSLLSCVLVAAGAVFRLSRVDAANWLRGGGGRTATLAGRRGRAALVVVQVALAVVLLAGAGLMVRSLENLMQADLGIAPRHVITAYVGPPQSKYPTPEDRAQLYRALADGVARVPGVRRVAGSDPLPMSGRNSQWTLSNDGFPQIDELGLRVDLARTMPGYFDIMGVRVVAGRDFREDDVGDNPVVVIDRTLAKFLWPDGDALGNRLRFRGNAAERPWFTVVGVVEHVKNYGVRSESRYELYRSYRSSAWGMSIVVEAETDNATEMIVAGLRSQLAQLDPELPLTRVATMDRYIDDSVADEALLTRTLAGFAAAALLVAIIGLYGVIAYSVTVRTREFGIRMALGAQQGAVLRNVLREGATLTGLGIALGIGGALLSGRLLASLLYGVEPNDLITLAAVVAIMGTVALLASVVAARQAVRVDPSIALRE